MSNKLLFARLAIVICLLSTASTRAQDSDNSIPDSTRALAFVHRVQAALRSNNPEEMAPLVQYPLRVDLHGTSRMIRTKTDLLRNYHSIFTPARIKAILRCKDSQVRYRDMGYSIPRGVIWFEVFVPEGQSYPPFDPPTFAVAGKFGIETVNPAPEEAK